MGKAAVYIHGKGGSAGEAAHYRPLLRQYDVIGFDYRSQTPWAAKEEFPPFIDSLGERYASIILVASSIGAYFAMHALAGRKIDKAFLISPIVDMEKLIRRMMLWAGVTENALKERLEIPTAFGETLSWHYLCYARAHPLDWNIPTDILFGEKDNITPYPTMSDFAHRAGAALTVMKNGEHWFHTEEQMAFLDAWLARSL